MATSELNAKNFIRISLINWSLAVPFLLLFSWPYYFFARLMEFHTLIVLPGALLFGLPFMITLLHGHVTLALGAAHRDRYYEFLTSFPFTYGLLFHPIIIRTRFRLTVLSASVALFLFGVAMG